MRKKQKMMMLLMMMKKKITFQTKALFHVVGKVHVCNPPTVVAVPCDFAACNLIGE